jgi:hypothetical protein
LPDISSQKDLPNYTLVVVVYSDFHTISQHSNISLSLTEAFVGMPVTKLLSDVCGETKTVGENINKSILITLDFSLGVVEQTSQFVEPCILGTFSLTTKCFSSILPYPVS